jgi:Putative restriction endonuclease
MTVTPLPPSQPAPASQPTPSAIAPLTITWEKLPDDYKLEEKPVDNTGQPLLAMALRESLEITGFIQPQMLIAANFGLCATVNGELAIKAPDWLYVPAIHEPDATLTRRSYTPNLEGELPIIVMEFLSDIDGTEYSVKRTPPPGKWFFYEQVLAIPIYVIFEPEGGLLELYRLNNGRYELEIPNPEGQHWIDQMGLFLGAWRGPKIDRDGYWLRWWDAEGQLLPWAIEQIASEQQKTEAERQRAEAEHQRAEAERQRADRLADYLRSQGIDPSEL